MAIVIYALAGVVVLVGIAAAVFAPTANMGATEALFARLVVLLPAGMFALVLFSLGAIVGVLQRLERRAEELIGTRAPPQTRAKAPSVAAEPVAEVGLPAIEEPLPLSPALFEPPASAPPPPTAQPTSVRTPLVVAEPPPPPRVVAPEPAEPPPAPSRPTKPRLEVATLPRAPLGLAPRPEAPPPPRPEPPPPPPSRPLPQVERTAAEPPRLVVPTPPLDLPPPPEPDPVPHEAEAFADEGPAFDLRLPDLALGPLPPSAATERERSPAPPSLDELLKRAEPARPPQQTATEPPREPELPRALPLTPPPAPPSSPPELPPLPSFDTGFLAKALLEPEPPAPEPEPPAAEPSPVAPAATAPPPPPEPEPPLPQDEPPETELPHTDEADARRAPTIAELLERDIDHEPQEPEPSARIVREGQFAGRRYRMFENGSLEIDTDQSTIRFGSLDEFRAFVSAAARKTPAST